MKPFKMREFLKTAAITGIGLAISPGIQLAEPKVRFQRSKPYTWSTIASLSEVSIASNSSPQFCSDFTRGRWQTNKPIFEL